MKAYQTVVLHIAYDPEEVDEPSGWNWRNLTDHDDDVAVIGYSEPSNRAFIGTSTHAQALVEVLRTRGYAVCAFSPRELGNCLPQAMQEHLCIEGNRYLVRSGAVTVWQAGDTQEGSE